MRKSRFMRIPIVAVVAALSVVAAGVGTAGAQTGGRPGVSSTTISVGGLAGVTNPVGQPYASGFDGIQAYFNYINAKGGVYGHKFKLVAKLDDQSRASQDLQAARSLVEESKVFAVAPVVTQEFTAATYLAGKGVPTLGWNINAEWATGYPTPGAFSGFTPPVGTTTPGAANLFGERGSYLCLNCTEEAPAYIAQQLGAKTVGVLAYSAAQSAPCAAGMVAGFKKYGINVAVEDTSIPFGFTDLGSDIDAMKSKGVQFVGTCMDIAGEVNVALALQRAGLTNVKFYAPEGYNPVTLSKYGNELNGIYFGIDFWPFELAKQSPALTRFITQMNKIKKPVNEQSLAGWIDADMLYKGIKKAGPNFTQKSVVDAINTFNGYTADGIRPPTNWGFDGHGPGTETCTAYVEVVGGKFAAQFAKPGQPFVCSRDDPLPDTLDSSTIYYRPVLAGQTLPTTATVPSTAPPTP
jgi:ABC-type branched-subunit amino acid transport system substrate-binding protein